MPAAAQACATARAIGLHGRKALAPRSFMNADEVDDRIGAAHGGRDRSRIAQIGLDRVDLTDHAQRLQEPGEIGPANRDAHAVAALDQRANDVAADKSRAAEDRDELLSRAWVAIGALR